jgi:hypothetical protein
VFANTHPFADAPYARNVVVSDHPFTGKAQLPWVELGAYAGGTPTVQLGDVRDASPPEGNASRRSTCTSGCASRIPARATARRRWQYDARRDAAACRRACREVRDRPAFAVSVQVTPGGLAQCAITPPFAVRDSDFDVVRYRYRWVAGAP